MHVDYRNHKEEFLLYEILAIAVKALVSSAKSVIIIIVGSFIPLQTIPKNVLESKAEGLNYRHFEARRT